MKVIYISHSREIQGAAKALINIVDGIRAFGVTPIVVVPGNGSQLDELNKLGVKVYKVNCYQVVYPPLKVVKDFLLWPMRLFAVWVVNFIAICKLARIVNKEKPDIIHSNTGIIRFGEYVAKYFNVPHVWHIREYQTQDFKWSPIGGEKKLRKLFSGKNNHCIAITKGVFDYFNLTGKDIVIYDGVFHDTIELPNIKKSDYFLFVGSISYVKGVMDALDAFNRIAAINQECRLLLAGRGAVDIENEISKSSFSDRICYLGQRKDIYELMSGALALLVPSYHEGFGFITAEAMLNKCVVIGRDTAGTKEQFDNGRSIVGKEIAFRFITIDQLVDCMQKVIDDNNTNLIDEMKEDAYNVVKQLYTIEKNVSSIYTYYCSII